jgi:hypothetical protein
MKTILSPDRAPVNTQKPLSVILDEIEERATEWTVEKKAWDGCDARTNFIKVGAERIASVDYGPAADNIVAIHNASARTDVLKLVKALHGALLELKNLRPVEHLPTKAESDITAILNQK